MASRGFLCQPGKDWKVRTTRSTRENDKKRTEATLPISHSRVNRLRITPSGALELHPSTTGVHHPPLFYFLAVEFLYKSLSGCLPVGDRCRLPVKTATDTLDIGRTVEKTTVTRVIPADLSTGERKTPDFFEYIEKLLPAEWQRHPKHTLYIYRRHGDSGSGTPLEKLFGFFPLPNQEPVPLNDREELETVIAQKYGGGTYRLVLKKGSERITEGRITIDGPPKSTRPGILDTVEENSSTTGVSSPDPSTDIAKTAMHMVANQDAEGLRLGMSALHNAADVVQRFSSSIGAPSAPAPGPMDELTRQFMAVMMQKMLNPPDPLELIKTVMALMGTVNTSGANPMVEKIINGALDRFMNAPAVVPGGGPVSTGAALVGQLPQIASYVTEAVREWRVGSEAQLHTAQIMANSRPPALPAAPGVPAAPPPGRAITQATQLNPAPPAAPTAEAQVMPAGTPSLEFIESKIVEILKKQISADDAADEVLSFLDLMAPTMVDQLAACTEAQLVQLFQARPVLRQYHDLARLQEFVRSFLKFANDNGPAPGVIDTSKPN